jgi:hypothetical protein
MGDSIPGQQSEQESKQIMTMKSISTASAMLITLSLSVAQAVVRVPTSISVADLAKETLAKKTLQQVQASASAVATQADQLGMISDSKASSDSHLAKLTVLKAEVNRMGQEMSNLEAERESLVPWEQQAVDKVLRLLQATAANTDNAIAYFNENRHSLWTEAYRDYAHSVRQDSAQISKTLKDYLKYDKLREQEVRAEERIWADAD